MKRFFMAGMLCLATATVFAQKKTEYKASNGVTYHIGDTIKLARGSDPKGNFMYVQIGGWAKSFTYNADKGASQYDLDRSYAGSGAIIKKIRSDSYRGVERIVFVVGLGSISNYDLYIEDAIATCEVENCNRNSGTINAAPQTSAADELAKYKKLLDQGAITKAEYEAQKKKLLNL